MRKLVVQYAGTWCELWAHDDDQISDIIAHSGTFYEAEILDFIRSIAPEQSTIVDAGANIGNHCVFFQRFLHCKRLIAIEPFPPNFEVLKKNVTHGAELLPLALGSERRTMAMGYVPGNMGSPFLKGPAANGVQVVPLDDLQLADVTLLKIDVEIHFLEVLKGALQTLRRCHPLLIAEGKFDEIFPLISPCGYACIRFWPAFQTYCFAPLAKRTP